VIRAVLAQPELPRHWPQADARQRRDASTGLMYYRARYYDPTLGRFISADAIVPGAASGVGGGVTTLGYDRNTRLTPLTVNLGEFAEQIGAENREVLQFGAFFQWDSETRQEHNVPMGPANPQALNRYAYCLGNPLRYVDPTGYFQVELSAKEAAELMDILDQISEISLYQGIVGEIGAAALNFFGQKLLSDEFVALALGLSVPQTGLVLALSGISMMLTADDLNNIRIAMGDLGADETGAKISITPGVFGSQSTITTVEGRRTLKLRNLSLTGSAAPWIFGGMMIGYRAREWLFPNPKYSVYIPFVAR
jgi:RHS repeat-associated protein